MDEQLETDPALQLEWLLKLKQLVATPDARGFFIQDDTILGMFVVQLSDLSNDLALLALEILQEMSADTTYCPRLNNFLGMRESLTSLSQRNCPDRKINELATALLAHLANPHPDPDTTPRPCEQPVKVSDKQETPVKVSSDAAKSTPKRVRRNSMAVKKNHLNSKSITLQIRGMENKDDIDSCRQVLMNVRGVISLFFVPAKSRCCLRVKPDLKVEVLAKAVKTLYMSAERVVKDEEGVEFTEPILNASFDPALLDYDDDEDDSLKVTDPDTAVKKPTADERRSTWGGWGISLLKTVAEEAVKSVYW